MWPHNVLQVLLSTFLLGMHLSRMLWLRMVLLHTLIIRMLLPCLRIPFMLLPSMLIRFRLSPSIHVIHMHARMRSAR